MEKDAERSKIMNNKTIKIKPEQSIVFYEYFFERDCFGDGDWDQNVKIFDSGEEAIDFVAGLCNGSQYRRIYGPFKQL